MRASSFRARAGVCFLAAACMAAVPAFAQQKAGGDAISAEAKEHFRAGVDLLKDPDGARYGDAYIQFKLAYDKSGKSWKVLGNLGLCAMKLERDGEAIEYYDRYLKEGAKEIDQGEREQVERDLRVLKNGVSNVVLKADVTTPVAVRDSRTRERGDAVNNYTIENGKVALGLRAGHHTIVASSAGKDQTWTVDLTPGTAPVEHAFTFQTTATPPIAASAAPTASASAAAVPTSAPTETAPPPPPAPNTMRTVGFVAAGVGGAMILGGVVTGLMGKSKFDDVKSSCDSSTGVTRCPQSKQSDADGAKSLATITNILLIGGAVVAAGGVTLVVLHPNESQAAAAFSPRVTVGAAPTLGGGALFANGTFLSFDRGDPNP